MTSKSGIPVTEQDLRPYNDRATLSIGVVEWRTMLDASGVRHALQLGWDQASLPEGKAGKVSLHQQALRISNDPLLLDTRTNTVLDVVRDAMGFGSYIEQEIGIALDIAHLDELNSKGRISPQQQTERGEKHRALAATRLFCVSYYIMWHLHDFHSEEVATVDMRFPGLPEVALGDGDLAVKCALYYYGKFIADSGLVNTPNDLIKFTTAYFGAMLDRLAELHASLKYTEVFKRRMYILEGSEFFVKGFEENFGEGSIEEEVTEVVQWGDVIGNTYAKRVLPESINRAFLQDQATLQNPIARFGGYHRVVIMHGWPGNGKTHTMFAVMTHARHIAEVTGRQIKIVMWPRNLKNKYQGVQEERNAKLAKSLSDPRYLYFIFVDEAEVVVPDREREGISTGDETSTTFMLDITKGSQKKPYHFWFFATNHIHRIDPAMRDRADVLVEMTGAETENDMIDFLHLKIKTQDAVYQEALRLSWPAEYEHFADQRAGDREKHEDAAPAITDLDEMFAEAASRYTPDTYRFWGRLLYLFLRAHPEFSLRKVGTIIETALFDLTTIQIDEEFLKKDGAYQTAESLEAKEEIVRQLVMEHLKHADVSFVDKLREASRQVLGELAKADDVKFERAVEKMLFSERVMAEVRRRQRI